MRKNPRQIAVHRGASIAYDNTVPTIYGGAATACCPPLFGQCVDGTIGIFHTGGESELALGWFGLKRATARRTEVAYLQYIGAIKAAGGHVGLPGVPTTICDVGDLARFGEPCIDVQDCFGLIKICSDPMVNGGNSLPYCERYPRFTIDGVQVDDDIMWHEHNATEAMLSDLAYNLLWGYKDGSANKMGHYGLWSLMGGYGDAKDYTYPCPELEPHILDWGGNPACNTVGQGGITLDGQALAEPFTLNLYSTLRDYLRGMRRRMRRTQGIAQTNWSYGDWALLGPEEVFDCIVACETCFTECNNNFQYMDTERAAMKLQELRNAGEGYGGMDFDGFEVPMIPFDPTILTEAANGTVTPQGSLKNADGTYNFLFLFRGSGNQRVFQPEFNPLDDGTWDTRDNGMTQIYENIDGICKTLCARTEWRWAKRAPFMQLLVKNVDCDTLISDTLVTDFTRAVTTCT